MMTARTTAPQARTRPLVTTPLAILHIMTTAPVNRKVPPKPALPTKQLPKNLQRQQKAQLLSLPLTSQPG